MNNQVAQAIKNDKHQLVVLFHFIDKMFGIKDMKINNEIQKTLTKCLIKNGLLNSSEEILDELEKNDN
jgi:hypothetical protein